MASLDFGTRTTAPDGSGRTSALLKKITRKVLNRTASKAKRSLQKTVSSWDVKPDFKVSTGSRKGTLFVKVSTTNQIYIYVTMGTDPHPITPTNADKLTFQNVYSAKTTPNKLMSQSGGKSGDWVSSDGVDHPGTEARNFHTLIAKDIQVDLHKGGNEIMRTWLQQTTRPAKKTSSLLGE